MPLSLREMKLAEKPLTTPRSSDSTKHSKARLFSNTNRRTVPESPLCHDNVALNSKLDRAFCPDSDAEWDEDDFSETEEGNLPSAKTALWAQPPNSNTVQFQPARQSISDYKKTKRAKLQNSDAVLRNAVSDSLPPIFHNLAIHVTGYTQPPAREIRKLVVSRGGRFLVFLDDWSEVTHIVASQLAAGKVEEFIKKGKARGRGHGGVKVIKPEWIVESVKAGRLLSCDPFAVRQSTMETEKKTGQMALRWERGAGTQAIASNESPGDSPKSEPPARRRTTETTCLSGLSNFLYLPFSAQPPARSEAAYDKQTFRTVFNSSRHRSPVQGVSAEDACEDIDESGPIVESFVEEIDDFTIEDGRSSREALECKVEHLPTKTGGSRAKFCMPPLPSALQTKRKQSFPAISPTKRPKRFGACSPETVVEDDRPQVGPISEVDATSDLDNVSESKLVGTRRQEGHTLLPRDALKPSNLPHHAARPPTPNSDPAGFIQSYYSNSRLHHLSTWKSALQTLVLEHQKRHPPLPTTTASRRYIIHADFDAFFATVSGREHFLKRSELDPAQQIQSVDIKTIPIAVAHGSGPTACIASCNYPARKFGIKNGVMMKDAKARCKDLLVVGYEFAAYEQASRVFYDTVLEMFGESGCVVKGVSVDEVVVDATASIWSEDGSHTVHCEKATSLASTLRSRVFAKTGCTISVGIGPNPLLARIALKHAKPDGQYLIGGQEADVREVLDPLPVKLLPGIGWHIASRMAKDWDVSTVADLRKIEKGELAKAFGPNLGEKIWKFARGVDDEEIKPGNGLTEMGDDQTNPGKKSIAAKITWGIRLNSIPSAERFVTQLCVELHRRLQSAGVRCQNLMLKVLRRAEGAPENPPKYLGHGDCVSVCRSIGLIGSVDAVPTLAKAAIGLLRKIVRETHLDSSDIRGLGVHVSGLTVKGGSQQTLDFGTKERAGVSGKGPATSAAARKTPDGCPKTPTKSGSRKEEDAPDIVTPTKICPREDAEVVAASNMFAPTPSGPDFGVSGGHTPTLSVPQGGIVRRGSKFLGALRSHSGDGSSLSERPLSNCVVADCNGNAASSFTRVLSNGTVASATRTPASASRNTNLTPAVTGRSRLNLAGSQFFLPSQVDPEVLAELPEDVRARLRRPDNQAHDTVSPHHSPFISPQGLGTQPVAPASAERAAGRLNGEGRNGPISPAEAPGTTSRPPRLFEHRSFDVDADLLMASTRSPLPPRQGVIRFASTPSRLVNLPAASQLDPDTLTALPPDLQEEILREYSSRAQSGPEVDGGGATGGGADSHSHLGPPRFSLPSLPPRFSATKVASSSSGPTQKKGRASGAVGRGGNMTLTEFMARQAGRAAGNGGPSIGGTSTTPAETSSTGLGTAILNTRLERLTTTVSETDASARTGRVTTMPPPPPPSVLLPRTPAARPNPSISTFNLNGRPGPNAIPSSPAVPSISPSFIAALPDDLRDEALEQGRRMVESWEWDRMRRRRERLKARNSGGTGHGTTGSGTGRARKKAGRGGSKRVQSRGGIPPPQPVAIMSRFLPPLRLPQIQPFRTAPPPPDSTPSDIPEPEGEKADSNSCPAAMPPPITSTLPSPAPPAPTEITGTALPSLRLLISTWTDTFRNGPYPEDVAALAEYLKSVVVVEKDMAKALGVSEWLKWKVKANGDGARKAKADAKGKGQAKGIEDGEKARGRAGNDDEDGGDDEDDIVSWAKAIKTVTSAIKSALRHRRTDTR